MVSGRPVATYQPGDLVARIDFRIDGLAGGEESELAGFLARELASDTSPLRNAIAEELFDLPHNAQLRIAATNVHQGSIEVAIFLAAAVITIVADWDDFMSNLHRAARTIAGVIGRFLPAYAPAAGPIVATIHPLARPAPVAAPVRGSPDFLKVAVVGYLLMTNAVLIAVLAWLALRG